MSRTWAQPRLETDREDQSRVREPGRSRRNPPTGREPCRPALGRHRAPAPTPEAARSSLCATNQETATPPDRQTTMTKPKQASVTGELGKLSRTRAGQARDGTVGWASTPARRTGACPMGTSIHRPCAAQAKRPPESQISQDANRYAETAANANRSPSCRTAEADAVLAP